MIKKNNYNKIFKNYIIQNNGCGSANNQKTRNKCSTDRP